MSIEKVAVLGGGLMGSGIAEAVARVGIPVTVRDVDEAVARCREASRPVATCAQAAQLLDLPR